LRAWFDSLGLEFPADRWTPRQLAIAATFFRTDRAVRAAQIHEADAALVTAGARPQPGVSTDLEYAFTDPQADSRWGLALAGLFTIELGGKRGARIGRARAAAFAVRAAAMEDEWRQVNDVYQGSLALSERDRQARLAREERLIQDSIVLLARARFDAGTLTRLDLARAEGDQRVALSEEARLNREAHAANVALAAAVGLPGSVTSSLVLNDPDWPECGADPSADRDSLQRAALNQRPAIRRAAAEYQVAEGDLRIQVANASPDLTLGPGIFFDQGSGKFTLGLGLPSLNLSRNRGPIREAEAHRELAGTRLLQEQERVLAEVDAAISRCELAGREVGSIDSLTTQAERRHTLLEAAWNRGEVGRLEVLATSLDVTRARRLALESRLRQWEAGLELERAVGAWGLRRDGDWPRRRTE
jgi:outer membrane protein TolC